MPRSIGVNCPYDRMEPMGNTVGGFVALWGADRSAPAEPMRLDWDDAGQG